MRLVAIALLSSNRPRPSSSSSSSTPLLAQAKRIEDEDEGRGRGRLKMLLAAIALFYTLVQGADDSTLVLDERAYVRSYYQFDWDRMQPRALKEAVERDYLTKGDLRTLERLTKARLAFRKLDWEKEDWRDHAAVRFVCSNAGIQPAPEAERFMNRPAPPEGWAEPGFDDGGWPRERKPWLIGRPELGFGVQNLNVRACFYRFPFFVPEPAEAGDLSLSIAYRGGVRVLLNGEEVARGHLPQGGLADAHGEDYPLDAYIRRPDEMSERSRKRLEESLKGGKDRWPGQEMYLPEMFGRFADMPHPHNQPDVAECHRGTTSVARKTWERIQTLRDRRLADVKVPAKLLQKGENVLAIEVRAARIHPVTCREGQAWVGWGNYSWPHAQVNAFALRCPSGELPSMVRRPAGIQVWAVDPHHRLHDTEWGAIAALSRESATIPAPAPTQGAGTVRFVGARNGTYSAQLAVGADKPLRGLRVTAEVKGLPARAVAMQPHPLSHLAPLCGGRSKTLSDPIEGGMDSLRQYGLSNVEGLPREKLLKAMDDVAFFDHIPAVGPAEVPEGKAQAIWVSISVPPEAAPGTYKGSVTIQAEGMEPKAVPVEVEVVDWRLPASPDFRTAMALEQSPYGVAKQYGVTPWSEEHFRLLDASLRLLGRAGNQWAFVPVLTCTELGNRDDSPLKWIRRKDGSLAFDYTLVDRYLDMVRKHWGTPRVICFVVMHGNPANPPEVMVRDEATGKREAMKVAGPTLTEAQRRAIWGAFATATYNHMKARGEERALFWGYAWDSEGDPNLKYLLDEFTPDVYWAMGGHELRTHPKYYKAFSWIYKVYSSMSLMQNDQGWRNPKLEFQNPRGGGSVLCLPGNSPPFGFRLAVDRALTVGTRGVGRLGADYWKEAYFDGTRGGEVYLQPGMPVHALFWPGPAGAESSARFEMMLEGLQEAEARIFIEDMLGRKILPDELAKRASEALFGHLQATVYIPAGVPAARFFQYGAAGWQERSRRLYQMAAEIAGSVGIAADGTELAADVPARSQHKLALTLRNWTSKPRAWKAASDAAWLMLAKSEGALDSDEELALILDGEALPAGKAAKGALSVTDVTSGRTDAIAVTANVSPVFSLSLDSIVLNVPTGGSDARTLTLFNRSAKELRWRAAGSEGWLMAAPGVGSLPPGEAMLVKIKAAPPDKAAARREATVGFLEAGGESRLVQVTTCILPDYQAPAALPPGQAVPLEDVDKKHLVRHGILAHGVALENNNEWMRTNDKDKPRIDASMYYGWHIGTATLKGWKKDYAKALWVRPHHESVYKLEGSSFTAFAAEAGIPKENANPQLHRDARACFEVWLDGKLAAQSGLMTLGDEPRLLVATSLDRAKEIKLVTRLDSLKDSQRILLFWAEPRFFKNGVR